MHRHPDLARFCRRSSASAVLPARFCRRASGVTWQRVSPRGLADREASLLCTACSSAPGIQGPVCCFIRRDQAQALTSGGTGTSRGVGSGFRPTPIALGMSSATSGLG